MVGKAHSTLTTICYFLIICILLATLSTTSRRLGNANHKDGTRPSKIVVQRSHSPMAGKGAAQNPPIQPRTRDPKAAPCGRSSYASCIPQKMAPIRGCRAGVYCRSGTSP